MNSADLETWIAFGAAAALVTGAASVAGKMLGELLQDYLHPDDSHGGVSRPEKPKRRAGASPKIATR